MANLVVRRRRVLDNFNNLGVLGGLLETDDKIDDRHVLRRDTERQTANKPIRTISSPIHNHEKLNQALTSTFHSSSE
jgi:hypothetical protein